MSTSALRTVAYLRVSTDKQADNGVSLAAQREKVKLYAQLYDLDLVEVIEDAGESAKSLNRPGLNRVLSMLDSGEVGALLIVKLDRLTRSVKDLGELLERYFGRRNGPALLSVAEQVDTRSAAGRLVLNVLMSVAQWEREATGERTSAAMRYKASIGEYTGGRIPYGWSLSDDGVKLQPEANEQRTIRRARELRGDGYSLREIGGLLVKEGHPPRRGKKWYASSIRGVLVARLDGEKMKEAA